MLPRALTEFMFFDANEESWMSGSLNDGPSDFKFCVEFFLELYFPFCGSLTGAHLGLLTSENRKALESCWYAGISFLEFLAVRSLQEKFGLPNQTQSRLTAKRYFLSTNFYTFQPPGRCHQLQ